MMKYEEWKKNPRKLVNWAIPSFKAHVISMIPATFIGC